MSKNRINFDSHDVYSAPSDENVVTVEIPSAEEIYSDHYKDLNDEESKIRKGVSSVINEVFENSSVNIPDGEPEPRFKRIDPKMLEEDDRKHLNNCYEKFDKETRPKIRKSIKTATIEDEEAMNDMARKLYGAEI